MFFTTEDTEKTLDQEKSPVARKAILFYHGVTLRQSQGRRRKRRKTESWILDLPHDQVPLPIQLPLPCYTHRICSSILFKSRSRGTGAIHPGEKSSRGTIIPPFRFGEAVFVESGQKVKVENDPVGGGALIILVIRMYFGI